MRLDVVAFVLYSINISLRKVNCLQYLWGSYGLKGDLNLPLNMTSRISAFPDILIEFFPQKLDHFDQTNTESWQQRYYKNGEFYKSGGPIFLLIGAEGEAQLKWMKEGAWIQYAKHLNAMLYEIEHRFYGRSRPTEDLSTPNLRYLNSAQTLADYANFIVYINKKENYDSKTKWIVFGGSYPGALAAWLRKKYSHLVQGGISSSAPLLAKLEFSEYFEAVGESIRNHSEDCANVVQSSMSEIQTLMKDLAGQKVLDKKLDLCDPVEESVDNDLDISNLFDIIVPAFASVVQYNMNNSPFSKYRIADICNIMTNETIGSPFDRLVAFLNDLANSTNNNCLEFRYDKKIQDLKNESWDSEAALGMRQWTYQICTELGFFQIISSRSIFGKRTTLDFYINQCSDIFGDKFNRDFLEKSILETNIQYGGLNLATTKVLYVHGSMDPWHLLGLIDPPNPDLPTIFLRGNAHCSNIYEPSNNDLPQLVEARKQIEKFIADILK